MSSSRRREAAPQLNRRAFELARLAHGPGSRLDATAGSGDGNVRIETFSGNVDVRRQ